MIWNSTRLCSLALVLNSTGGRVAATSAARAGGRHLDPDQVSEFRGGQRVLYGNKLLATEASRGFEERPLDSDSGVATVTPRRRLLVRHHNVRPRR